MHIEEHLEKPIEYKENEEVSCSVYMAMVSSICEGMAAGGTKECSMFEYLPWK